MCVCVDINMYMCVYIYIPGFEPCRATRVGGVCMHIRMYMYMYTYRNMYKYMYTYIYIVLSLLQDSNLAAPPAQGVCG